MKDGFEATFVVEFSREAVWKAVANRAPEEGGATERRYVLPGFPAFGREPGEGAWCTELEVDPGKLLRVRKDDQPCAGTEIGIVLEAEGSGTRVTIVQTGFGDFLKQFGGTAEPHARQIFRDFRLWIERGIRAPGTTWGVTLAAETRETPIGLEITGVHPGGFGERIGLEPGDLLLTFRGVRVHDTQQLWSMLALTEAGSTVELSWARGRELMGAKQAL